MDELEKANSQIEKYGFFMMYSEVLGEEILIKMNDDCSISDEKIFNRVKDAPRYTLKEAAYLIGLSEDGLKAVHMVKSKIKGTVVRRSESELLDAKSIKCDI